MTPVNLRSQDASLGLVDAAGRGEEIIIAKNGVAKARLAPIGPLAARKPSKLMRISFMRRFELPTRVERLSKARVSLLIDTHVFSGFRAIDEAYEAYANIATEPDVSRAAASGIRSSAKGC